MGYGPESKKLSVKLIEENLWKHCDLKVGKDFSNYDPKGQEQIEKLMTLHQY